MFTEGFKIDLMGNGLMKLKGYVDKGRVSGYLINTEKSGYTATITLNLRFVFSPYNAMGEIDFKLDHIATEIEKRKAIGLLTKQAIEFLKKIK